MIDVSGKLEESCILGYKELTCRYGHSEITKMGGWDGFGLTGVGLGDPHETYFVYARTLARAIERGSCIEL